MRVGLCQLSPCRTDVGRLAPCGVGTSGDPCLVGVYGAFVLVYRIDLESQVAERDPWLQCDFCAGWPRQGEHPQWWVNLAWTCIDHAELVQRLIDLRDIAQTLPHVHA